MLAIVREDAIAAFAKPRARTLNHGATIEGSRVVPHSNRVAMSEALK
jgi:hypothetical protein